MHQVLIVHSYPAVETKKNYESNNMISHKKL